MTANRTQSPMRIPIALITASLLSIAGCAAYKNTSEVFEAYKNAPAVQEAPRDSSGKAKQYLAAAEKGDSTAMLELGVLYGNGVGVPANYAEALRWYRLAAAKGE